jgi:SH3-like domain-containing protein
VSSDEIYYYQEKSGGIFSATENLRLRSEPETGKDNRIASIPKGSVVELLETGKLETIDDITAQWYKVKTANGTIGWVFSGYLSQTRE